MSYVYGMEVVTEKRKTYYEKNKDKIDKKAKEYRENLPRDGEVYLNRKKYMKDFNKKRNTKPTGGPARGSQRPQEGNGPTPKRVTQGEGQISGEGSKRSNP